MHEYIYILSAHHSYFEKMDAIRFSLLVLY